MTAARVTLRRMGAADVEDFLAATAPAYAAERAVADHVGEAEAAARARTQTDRLLSQRGDTPGHHFAAVVDTATGDRVGGVWFFLDAETREGFVYYLTVSPPCRRRGFARAALSEVEAAARAAGCRTLGLNVFAPNAAAIALYAGAGFAAVAQYMNKRL